MISATDNPFCASISLFSSTKLQPIFLASILPRADLPAPRGGAAPKTCETVLGRRNLVRGRLPHEVANDRPVRRRLVGRYEVFEMRAHCIRYPAQQHDRDVALAAFELGDIAFGDAGDFCEHLSRHAAQGAHGADTLAELHEKAAFGIGIFGHVPVFRFGRERRAFGNIVPTRIDSKRTGWLSMNYNSENLRRKRP